MDVHRNSTLFISRIWHLFQEFGCSWNFRSYLFPEIGIYSEYLEFILSFWCHFLRLIPFNPSFWMQLFREFGCSSNSHHIYSENWDLILVFGIYSEFLVAISSRNWLYSEFPVIFIPRNWFSTKPAKPKSRFNSKPKSHFLEIIPIISRYYVLVPPRITLLSTRKSTFRDEKKPSLFPFS